MIRIFALEYSVHFFSEQRTKPYTSAVKRAAQLKNVLSAKNIFQGQTCSGLGRYGA